jgi:hypothetical protein
MSRRIERAGCPRSPTRGTGAGAEAGGGPGRHPERIADCRSENEVSRRRRPDSGPSTGTGDRRAGAARRGPQCGAGAHRPAGDLLSAARRGEGTEGPSVLVYEARPVIEAKPATGEGK